MVRVQELPFRFGTTETLFIPARKQSCTSAPTPSIGTNLNTCRIGIWLWATTATQGGTLLV